MTKEEAREIKEEILKKEGTVSIHGTIYVDGVIMIEDVLKIITEHTDESEEKA